LLNIVIVSLVIVVAACNCDKLNQISNQSSSTPTSPSPAMSDSPTTTSSPKTSGKAELTLEKYDRIKTGMSLKEVEEIIGAKGEEMSSSEIGKYKIVSMKWDGGDFKYIYATFNNDKLTSKSQANLK
jgi:hypothetical protein